MTVQTKDRHSTPFESDKPPVMLDATHYSRLHYLAIRAMERAPDVAGLLLGEIARADLSSHAEMPEGVVNMGSEVTFRYNDNGYSQTIELVYPNEADIRNGRVSVLTPIGATLIGLSIGDQMSWNTRLGDTRSLTILKVTQPHEQLQNFDHGRAASGDS